MRALRLAPLLVIVGLSLVLAACGDSKPASETKNQLKGVQTLHSYRWTTELRADSSLFDQSQAPEALRVGPFVLKAHVTGERIAPDREHAKTIVEPVTVEPREAITVGTQHWNRIGNGPWRVGVEAFPAARAYFGGSVTLSARALLEPSETSTIAQLRKELATMPYREETVATGPARRYTLRPDQVALVVADPSINPFAVLKTLPAVRIDLWIDQERLVLVGLRTSADSPTLSDAFVLELRVTEIEPTGVTIEAPR